MTRYAESERLAAKAAALIPNGAQTMSKSPHAFPDEFPKMLDSAEGANVRDVDGNVYTDWICGLGANGLGANGRVHWAAIDQIESGVTFSLPTALEAQVAELLVDLIPCAEQVRFVKTGSEACSAAVRIARIATGRDRVLVCGYHGWHDWYVASRDKHPGVPHEMCMLIDTFKYNDLASLNRMLALMDVAAVIIEPVLHEAPEHDFLQGVAAMTRKEDALLIFDENVTGFRVDLRGAQHHYRVTPDLAVFGKAMANGFPLAAVVGKRKFMQYATPVSGTFGGEAVSLAAAKATIEVYRETNPIPTMHRVGYHLLRELRRNLTPEFTVDGMAWKPRISAEKRRLHGLVRGLARRGHLIHPGGFYVSCAHTMADVNSLAEACGAAAADDYSDIPEPAAMAWTR